MKTIDISLLNEYKKNASTLSTCMKIVRYDGLTFRVTDHDEEVTFNNEIYSPRNSYESSNINSSKDLSVDTLEISGVADPIFFNEADILAGRLDGSEFEFFRVNWLNPSHKDILRKGFLGSVTKTRSSIKLELRGLAQLLQQNIVESFNERCNADLFDSRCKVLRASFTTSSVIDALLSNDIIICNALSLQSDGYYDFGYVEFITGLNAGLKKEVAVHSGNQVTLLEGFPFSISIGDQIKVYAGCNKFHDTCKTKFNNLINFRGFAFIPGSDKIYGSSKVENSDSKEGRAIGNLID